MADSVASRHLISLVSLQKETFGAKPLRWCKPTASRANKLGRESRCKNAILQPSFLVSNVCDVLANRSVYFHSKCLETARKTETDKSFGSVMFVHASELLKKIVLITRRISTKRLQDYPKRCSKSGLCTNWSP